MGEQIWIGFPIIQAIGSIGTAIGIGFLVWSILVARKATQEAKRSADAATKATEIAAEETALRLRPWVGISGLGIRKKLDEPDNEENALLFRLENVGALPARIEYVEIAFHLEANGSILGERNEVIRRAEYPAFILPNNHVDFPFAWNREPQLEIWVGDGSIISLKAGSNTVLAHLTNRNITLTSPDSGISQKAVIHQYGEIL